MRVMLILTAALCAALVHADWRRDLADLYFVPAPAAAGTDDADYTAFASRVAADGGSIISKTDCTNAIAHAKANSYWTSALAWWSGQFAVKTNASGKVSKWYDLTTNNNDAVQADEAKQPTWTANQQNGRAAIVFNATDANSTNMTFTEVTTLRSLFWVTKERYLKIWHIFMGHTADYPFHRGHDYPGAYWSSTYADWYVQEGQTKLDGANVTGTVDIFPTNAFHIVSLVTTGDVKADSFQDREGSGWNGSHAEILLLNAALSSNEVATVENALNSKWSVY